jgi:hypothetical protein
MSNIHTLSTLSKSATASKQRGTQIGSTVYKTEGLGAGLLRHATKAAGGAAASGTGKGKSGGGQKLGNVRDLGSISKKLTSGLFGSASRDTALDKQLASAARQKQQSGLPMTADLRLAAMSQREPIRPEAKLLCPNQHKIAGPAAKKALTKGDVYTCTEEGCGALCGGADAHPLHLELKFLNPVDKHKVRCSVTAAKLTLQYTTAKLTPPTSNPLMCILAPTCVSFPVAFFSVPPASNRSTSIRCAGCR